MGSVNPDLCTGQRGTKRLNTMADLVVEGQRSTKRVTPWHTSLVSNLKAYEPEGLCQVVNTKWIQIWDQLLGAFSLTPKLLDQPIGVLTLTVPIGILIYYHTLSSTFNRPKPPCQMPHRRRQPSLTAVAIQSLYWRRLDFLVTVIDGAMIGKLLIFFLLLLLLALFPSFYCNFFLCFFFELSWKLKCVLTGDF